jgi:hypothetical protein
MRSYTYVVYDEQGNEVAYLRIKSQNQNLAESQAKNKYGPKASVSYTELPQEFDHIKSGFFHEHDAQ